MYNFRILLDVFNQVITSGIVKGIRNTTIRVRSPSDQLKLFESNRIKRRYMFKLSEIFDKGVVWTLLDGELSKTLEFGRTLDKHLLKLAPLMATIMVFALSIMPTGHSITISFISCSICNITWCGDHVLVVPIQARYLYLIHCCQPHEHPLMMTEYFGYFACSLQSAYWHCRSPCQYKYWGTKHLVTLLKRWKKAIALLTSTPGK